MVEENTVQGTQENGGTGKPLPHAALIVTPSVKSVALLPGGSATVTASVEYVGSTATAPAPLITLRLEGVPAGVTASLTPTSLTAKAGTVTLKLSAAMTAPQANASIFVGATGGGAIGSTTIGVTIPQECELVIGASGESNQSTDTPVTLAPLGKVSLNVALQVAAGVKGAVSLAMTTALPAGVTAQFEPASLTATGAAATLTSTLVLTAGATLTPARTNVTFAAQVSGAARGSYSFPIVLVAPNVTAVVPSSGRVPMLGQGGTQVTITGGGFAPGTTVTFGADTPVTPTSLTSTSLVIDVPATAASGPITVSSVSGAGPTFTVDNFRNTRGFSWVNSIPFQNMVGGSYSFADAQALFGKSQTDVFIFGNDTGWEDPLVALFRGIADVVLDSGGQCFGMSLASLRFFNEQVAYGSFPQQAANSGHAGPDAWQLDGPALGNGSNVSPALASYVHQQHLAQCSAESINNWLGVHVGSWSAATLRSKLQSALAGGNGAMVAVNPNPGTGHVVVAYAIVDRPDRGAGDFDIALYNCNSPYQTSEDSNRATRSSALGSSVINVSGGGTWTFSGEGWTGGMLGITVIPWGTIPNPPTIPLWEIIGLAATLLWIVAGDATVSQVSDSAGKVLLANGTWNDNPSTALTGVRPLPNLGGLRKVMPPAFVSNRADALTHTVAGNASGTYDFTWVGGGYGMTLKSVPTAAGTSDVVVTSKTAGKLDLTAAADKAITATVLGRGTTSKVTRAATLKTTAFAKTAVSVSFDAAAETFSYVHAGAPTTYSLELSSVDSKGAPATFTKSSVAVATGETHTFKPDWTQLAAGAGTLEVKVASGALTSRALK